MRETTSKPGALGLRLENADDICANGEDLALVTCYMTDSEGREVVKTFNRSEYSTRAKLLYNEITNSIDEMGQSITEQEKRQILIEILEKLC